MQYVIRETGRVLFSLEDARACAMEYMTDNSLYKIFQYMIIEDINGNFIETVYRNAPKED